MMLKRQKNMYIHANKFLDSVIQKHSNDDILFVTHGGFAKALSAVMYGLDCDELNKIDRLKNTSLTIFNLDDVQKSLGKKVYTCVMYNNIDHLFG